MTGKQKVDWALLPHQPMQFFGLNDDFNRRDLKRAYGRLIRKYKPETHPNEFQQVRRAYEELENQVRYGLKQSLIANQTQAWNSVLGRDSTDQAADRSRAKGTPDVAACTTQQAMRDPRGTYSRLKKTTPKSPQDYFVLAVLCDLVPNRSADGFLKWILQGLKNHATDAGLQQILREFLRTDVPLESASSVLLICSKTLSGEVFYRLTEPLWDRLLREVEFGRFSNLLATCERNVKHKDSKSRRIFYLHILRPAIWSAPRKWTDPILLFLESNGTELDGAAEQELEFLGLVSEYLRTDAEHASTHPIRGLLHEMLMTYCREDWNLAVAKVAQVQSELARNSHGVIDAYPVTPDQDCFRMLTLCMMVASDVAEQTAVSFDSTENRHSEKQSFLALGDLRESIITVSSRIQWQRYRGYIAPFVAIVLAPPILVFTAISAGMIALAGSLVWLVGSICLYYMWLKPNVLDPRMDERIEKILMRSYQDKWRSRLFRYVQSCGQPPQEAIHNLYRAAVDSGDGSWMNVVLSYIQGDAGLIMFGHAQMFVD